MAKRTNTTKDVAMLQQLHRDGQLELAAEFQRNSVWPQGAKAYLIDTILNDRPIPFLFFQKGISAQTARTMYTVIDGQQRLRALFDYLDDKFPLTESAIKPPYYKKRYSELRKDHQHRILQYDLNIEELSGYSENDIRDMFLRMNKYVVKLSRQEIRHARSTGAFRDLVENVGAMSFWTDHRVFTKLQLRRFRAVEFSAELLILLVEGPQDKKAAIDLYYQKYQRSCPFGTRMRSRLVMYLNWTAQAIPNLAKTRYRKPVDLYSVIGALHQFSREGSRLSRMPAEEMTAAFRCFEKETKKSVPRGAPGKYVVAASRQTDNIRPRTTRIETLLDLFARTYT